LPALDGQKPYLTYDKARRESRRWPSLLNFAEAFRGDLKEQREKRKNDLLFIRRGRRYEQLREIELIL